MMRRYWLILLLNCLPVLALALPVVQQRPLYSGLQQPVGVAVNQAGQIAVLDGAGLWLSKGSGLVKVPGNDIKGSSLSIAAYQQDWLVADPQTRRLLVLSNNGAVKQIIDVTGTADSARPPEPVAVAANAGLLFWVDRANHRICRYDLEKSRALNCFGKRGEMPGEFQYPYQIAFDRDGYVYVVDILNARIQAFAKDGRFFADLGHFSTGCAGLFRPNGIAVDSRRDLLLVSDSYMGTIKLFKAGALIGELTNKGRPLALNSPTSLAWKNNRLLVAETGGNRVLELTLPLDIQPDKAVVDKLDEAQLSQKNCLMCHLSWAKPPHPADAQGIVPEASVVMCYSCHNGAVMDSRFRIGSGGQHASVYDAADLQQARQRDLTDANGQRKDKLPEIFPRTADKNLTCSSCHTPHTKGHGNETLYEGHQNAWLRVPNKGGDLCERCHESKAKQARELDVNKRGMNHSLGIKLARPPLPDSPGFATEKLLHKGLPEALVRTGGVLGANDALICQTCHQVHGGHGDRELTALANDQGELCLTCHQKQASKDKKAAHLKGVHPVNVKPKKPMKKDNQEVKLVSCQSCHNVHEGSTGTALIAEKYRRTDDLCQTCHERQSAKTKKEARHKGIHPVNIEPEQTDEPMKKDGKVVKFVSCQTCHNVHDGQPDTPLLDKGIKAAEALCQTCHKRQHADNQEAAFKKGVHPVNTPLDEPVEIVAGKKTRNVGCLTCHAVHSGQPDTPALVEDHKDGQLCSHCHAGKQAVVGSDHDLRLTAKDQPNAYKDLPKAGVCSGCHSLHKGKAENPHLYAAKKVVPDLTDKEQHRSLLKEDQLCLNCHQLNGIAEKKIVKAFKHPHKNIVLRSAVDQMPLLDQHEKIQEFGEVACITCHDPHFWKPEQLEQAKTQPKLVKPTGYTDNAEGTPLTSFLRTRGVKDTFCVTCHGLEALPKFKYFHDKKLVRNKGLDYIQ